MHVVEQKTKLHREVRLMRVSNTELSKIPKSRFYFNWTTERDKLVFKLMLETEGILFGFGK